MSQKNFNSLDKVASELGVKDTIELCKFALPVIKERRQTLEQLLSAGDWAAAAQCAHKTISSVRLYGSEELESLLRQVQVVARTEELAPDDCTELQQNLSDEFQTVIDLVQSWLERYASIS